MTVALLILPDFLLIALGVLLKRRPAFADVWPGVERLVYFVLFPALLFRSLALATFRLADASALIGCAVGFTLAGIALSALARPVLRLPAATFAACFQCGFRFNTYLALAIASSLAGPAGVAQVSLLIGVLVPIVNFAAVAALAHGRGVGLARELARNPLVIACAAGIAWNVAGLPLPALPARILELLASAALPLGLLAAGAGLVLARGTLPTSAIAWWTLSKLVAVPAIAWALAHAIGLTPRETQLAVLLAAVPTAPSAYILAMQMGGHGAAVAMLISSGTLAAVVTLPVWMALVSGG